MFTKKSRYNDVETVEALDGAGRAVSAVKLRSPAEPAADPLQVKDGDQLDVLAKKRLRDPAGFWSIADANSELEANALVERAGRIIGVPRS